MRANTKVPPMRRSSSDRTYVIPIRIEHAEQPTELEQVADEAIRILAVKLAEVERERDSLFAAAVQVVKAMDDWRYSRTGEVHAYDVGATIEELRAAITD